MQKLRKKLTVGLATLLAVVMVSGNSASASYVGSVREDVFNAYNNVKYFIGNQTEAFKADPIGYALCDVVAIGGTWLYTAYTMKEIAFKNNGWLGNVAKVCWRIFPFSHFGKKSLIQAPCIAYGSYKILNENQKALEHNSKVVSGNQGDVVKGAEVDNEVEL